MAPKNSLDRAQIEHVAKLASLSLTEDEAQKLVAELDTILHYVDELNTVDTTDVPPTAHILLDTRAWREDEVLAGVTHEEALAQAPRIADGGFAVPAFVDAEGPKR